MASAAMAQPIYTAGHGDVGVGYDGILKEFDPHWHLGAGAIVDGNPLLADDEYAPNGLLAQTSSMRTSPTGLSSILGVADGSSIFAMGSSTYQPNLGFAVEELIPSEWSGDITVSLLSWTQPPGSQFALYTTNLAGTTVVDKLFSTFSPSATDFANSFTMTPGDHAHFQWGFTQPGTYELTFQWSGTHIVDGLITTSDTYSVQVIPEPSTVVLGLLGLGTLAWAVRKRRKN